MCVNDSCIQGHRSSDAGSVKTGEAVRMNESVGEGREVKHARSGSSVKNVRGNSMCVHRVHNLIHNRDGGWGDGFQVSVTGSGRSSDVAGKQISR